MSLNLMTRRGGITIPGWVDDHAAFRRWARSDAFPDIGRFAFLNGDLWMDLEAEAPAARSDREAPSLQILRLTKRGYVRAPVAAGFQRSAVFGRSFRLVTGRDRLGHPRYRLEVAAPPTRPPRPKRRTKK